MKRISPFLILFSLLITTSIVNAQQVIVTDDAAYTTPASGAMLDVKSTSKGFMPPRIALTSLTDVTTIASPATGLMVYNTGTGGLAEIGVFYWNGSSWVKLLVGGSGGTNYLSIADNGTVILQGSATTWNDLAVNPYSALNNGATKPGWTKFVDTNIFTWEFIDGNSAELNFMVQLPHDYKEGSNIFPHIHWSSVAAIGTNRVTWSLDYQWVNHTVSYTATTSNNTTGYLLAGSNPSRSVNAYEHVITPLTTTGISGSGKTVSSILLCRLSRVGTDSQDTFTGGAFMLSFDFHYEVDSFGSRGQFTKDTE